MKRLYQVLLLTLILSYCLIGKAFAQTTDSPFTIDSLQKELSKQKEDTNKFNILLRLMTQLRDDYPDSAMQFSFQGLHLAEKINWLPGIGQSYHHIATLYGMKGDFDNSLKTFSKAFKIWEQYEKIMPADRETFVQFQKAKSLGNIGMVNWRQNNYPLALEYYFKALEIDKSINNKKYQALHLANIGNVYKSMGDFTKALEFEFQALDINQKLDNKSGVAFVLGNIGVLYMNLKKYETAKEYLLKAVQISRDARDLYSVMEIKINISELYSLMGNYKEALSYFKSATSLKDTLYKEGKAKEISRHEVEFQLNRREALLKAEQDKKDAIAQEEKQRQRNILWSVLAGLLFTLLFLIFIFRSLRFTLKQKRIIEMKKIEVEKQKALVEDQKIVIEEKSKEIQDSINYALRIQEAKLPRKSIIYENLKQSFVLFKPKDVVSGDFYFFYKKGNEIFLAAVDCTGHGIPGAFMSMIGSEKLFEGVSRSSSVSAILKHMNIGIKASLRETDETSSIRDGMDIALCKLYPYEALQAQESCKLEFAGANRPLWLIRQGQKEIEEIKFTKLSIAGFTDDSQHFESYELELKKGDTFYIFSDGYADTFGKSNKKLSTKKLRQILIEIQHLNLREQENYLEHFIEEWKGETEQIDDILMIGVRV